MDLKTGSKEWFLIQSKENGSQDRMKRMILNIEWGKWISRQDEENVYYKTGSRESISRHVQENGSFKTEWGGWISRSDQENGS